MMGVKIALHLHDRMGYYYQIEAPGMGRLDLRPTAMRAYL